MNQPKERVLNPLTEAFVQNLQKLDAGERARLKRNAGNLPQEARRVLGLFYGKVLPLGVGEWAEKWYFLVATLYPLEKGRERATGNLPGNLALSLRQVRTEKNGAGLDRRVERLLDADEQQLPFQLRQTIHFLTSNRGRVNWGQLLQDLLNWSHPDRFVQKKWARDYFVKQTETETESN